MHICVLIGSAVIRNRYDHLLFRLGWISEARLQLDPTRIAFNQDVVSGPFWYAGPEFRERHRYMKGDRVSIKVYSKHFFSFAHDINGDMRTDILIVGMPGQPATWFENPGDGSEDWPKHQVLNDVGNESPTFNDR